MKIILLLLMTSCTMLPPQGIQSDCKGDARYEDRCKNRYMMR